MMVACTEPNLFILFLVTDHISRSHFQRHHKAGKKKFALFFSKCLISPVQTEVFKFMDQIMHIIGGQK